ncbi:MAG: FG-GAP repeat protein [Planctomycetes bacterium]|nr:FG-GAP repeat protein [Planctomycetota bacterium]
MCSVASFVGVVPLVLVGTLVASSSGRAELAIDVASHTAPAADSVPEGLTTSDWTSIRAAYEAGRHKIVAVDGGCGTENSWTARNPGQGLSTTFDGRGFATSPDGGSWSWGLELQSYGWDAADSVTTPCATSTDGSRLSRVWDERLTEWYVNDTRGLEHGFTIANRPASANAPLSVELSIRGGLQPVVSPDGRNVAFTDALGAAALNYNGLTVLDAAGNTVGAQWRAIGCDRLRLQVDDAEAHYPLTIDPIVQQAYLKAATTGADDRFGHSVSVSGDTVVVSARFEDSSATGVNGNQADNGATDSGAAYVFVRAGGVWSQQAYLKASNTEQYDDFGASVAISGDTLVVGAYSEDSDATGVNGNQASNNATDSGAVYVFVRSGGVWSQQAYLKASNTGQFDEFGVAVAISGDTLVVGANREDSSATGVNGSQANNAFDAGAAYVFIRSGGVWSQQAYLKASNTGNNDWFGVSVAIDQDTAVIGARYEDSDATGVNGSQANNTASVDSGAAYVFVRSGGIWSQQAYLKASNTEMNDSFGASVAVSGDTVVIGALWEDSSAAGPNGNQASNAAQDAGAAYVFHRTGGAWSQQAYLKASNTEAGDRFGYSVAVSGDTLVVGAPLEDSNTTGLNGNQADDSAAQSGAAYVFVRSGGVWSQQAYLKASNAQTGDHFGWSVAVAGDTLLVGANREDSSATGVNGNQADNSAEDSGAAYVFTLPMAVTYCTAGTSTNGCVPSISSTGWPSIAATSGFSINVANVEGQKQGLVFYGLSGRTATVWGAGGSSFFCVKAPTQRMQAQSAGGTSGLCDGVFSEDWLAYLATHPIALGQPFAAGTTVNAQAWYRDPPAVKSTNLSNALEFVTQP